MRRWATFTLYACLPFRVALSSPVALEEPEGGKEGQRKSKMKMGKKKGR